MDNFSKLLIKNHRFIFCCTIFSVLCLMRKPSERMQTFHDFSQRNMSVAYFISQFLVVDGSSDVVFWSYSNVSSHIFFPGMSVILSFSNNRHTRGCTRGVSSSNRFSVIVTLYGAYWSWDDTYERKKLRHRLVYIHYILSSKEFFKNDQNTSDSFRSWVICSNLCLKQILDIASEDYNIPNSDQTCVGLCKHIWKS